MLRPFIVVTGTPHAEGGERGQNGEKTVTADRKRANTLITDWPRKLRRLRACKTPFGTLVDFEHRAELMKVFDYFSAKIAAFNATSTDCKIENYLLWEKLRGNRLAAVEGWLAVRPELRSGLETVENGTVGMTL